MSNWEKLEQLWEKYFSMTVYGNKHLVKPLLHFWLGVYLTTQFQLLHSGQYKTFRVNPFIIQESGSGKSVAMKTTHFLLKKLFKNKEEKINSFYTLTMTDASMMGNVFYDKKGEIIKKQGELAFRDCIFWDEGSVLLKSGRYSESCCDILQMVLDDPGYVSRAMSAGSLEYPTTTSICAGSYMDDSIEKTIFKRGIFQRMWIVFNKTTTEQKLEYIEQKHQLIKIEKEQRDEVVNEIAKILYNIKLNSNIVKIDNESYILLLQEFKMWLMTKLKMVSFKDQKQEILESFITRNDIILSIASQKAIIENRNLVLSQDLKYGFERFKEHIRNAVDFLMVGEKMEKNEEMKKKSFVISIIQNTLKVYNKTELVKILIKHEEWNLGWNTSLTFIKKMQESGDIDIKKGPKGEYLINIGEKWLV